MRAEAGVGPGRVTVRSVESSAAVRAAQPLGGMFVFTWNTFAGS
jgi:hypothetical protein